MGDLTDNISRHELACKCGCGFDTVDYETIKVVQECCDHFAIMLNVDKVTLRVNSAARCYDYNRQIGGSPKSQHVLGRAIDFTIDGVSPTDVHAYLITRWPNKHGIGKYNSFTHVDSRTNGPARW